MVNSAGIVVIKPTVEFPVAEWEKIIRVNLEGTFLCCQAVGRVMLEQERGKIVNLSSVRGLQGRAQDPAYAASKGAVNLLTRSLAIEGLVIGLAVGLVVPSLVNVWSVIHVNGAIARAERQLNEALAQAGPTPEGSQTPPAEPQP